MPLIWWVIYYATQVGKRLRHLTKHPRKKIQSFASDLMEMWKDIVIKETNKNRKNESLDDKDSVKVETVDAETAKAQKVMKASSVKVEKAESIKVEKIERNGMPSSEKVLRSDAVKAGRKVQSVDVGKVEKTDSPKNVEVEKITKEREASSAVKCRNLSK
ncbi:hypothetical protein CJ030_MR4G017661 [Morella rubra]|uniref:TFIIS N-terminal domain-containing protein n=1 Tax=Morella rubra TaxID=262757 RepID=A0A6A1VVZ9_9ROSI|nr:hypothetical protein CJ030_MR4G017661 [Morella rubra]